MISGTITLYDRAGQPVDSDTYSDRYSRNIILDRWKNRYGKGYLNCEIGIEPDIYPDQPKEKNKIEAKYANAFGKLPKPNKTNKIKQSIIHQIYPSR